MGLEDFVRMVQTKIGLSSETFFLSSLGRVLDSVRDERLGTRFIRPCQFSVARWHHA